jgi:alanyl-tRNA synthetase
MGKTTSGLGAYVQRVREDTQRYAAELLRENETLRAGVASLTQDNDRLRREAERANAELEHVGERERRLQDALRRVEEENQHFASRYLEVEQENSNLANLYVASYRLHGSVDRREVLDVIQEIASNLIGCEEMAVFEMDSDGAAVSLVRSCGIDPTAHHRVAVGDGLIGRALATGETYVAGDERPAHSTAQEATLTACIPLKLGERVSGAIALYRLLPQKAGLGALDRELFELLATHAATALYSSGLEAKLAVPAP